MLADSFTTLLLGDIHGEAGCRAVFLKLNSLKKKYRADFVIVNGENCCKGFGLSVENMNMLFSIGVDVITSGNHIWQQEEILPYLDSESRILRPANYGNLLQGHGCTVYKGIGVVNVIGRHMLVSAEDPFRWAADSVRKLKAQTKTIFVDFHAESTEEKEAMGCFLDGEVTAVVGTHTHVRTMDERILSGGTAYITDLGMCGPINSVIGGDIETSLNKQKTQMPIKAKVADGEAEINGVCIVSDISTGKALSIVGVKE